MSIWRRFNLNLTKYHNEGFLSIEKGISEKQCSDWRYLSDEIERDVVLRHNAGEHSPNFWCLDTSEGTKLGRFNNLFAYFPQELANLIAESKVLSILKTILGSEFIISSADINYKYADLKSVVRWHQDSSHSRNHPYLNLGIYLDNSTIDGGCLKYVPGSQFEVQDIQNIEEEYGWCPPGLVNMTADAGDVIVHDMMVLHASAPRKTKGVRRTIYLEARPIAGLNEEEIASNEWLEVCKGFMQGIISQQVEEVFTEKEKSFFATNLSLREAADKMLGMQAPTTPAVYNHLPLTTINYP